LVISAHFSAAGVLGAGIRFASTKLTFLRIACSVIPASYLHFSCFCNIFRPQCPFFRCFAKWSWQNGACGSGGNRVRPALLPAFLQGKWHAARAAHLHLLPVFFRFLPEK